MSTFPFGNSYHEKLVQVNGQDIAMHADMIIFYFFRGNNLKITSFAHLKFFRESKAKKSEENAQNIPGIFHNW